MNPESLSPGDRYLPSGDHIVVTIIGKREEYSHWLTGPGWRYWASRSDTGAEGYVSFGPGAYDLEAAP